MSWIFYNTPGSQSSPDPYDFEADTYCWLERRARRLARQHERERRLVTGMCVLLAAASIVLGIAVWPTHEKTATTKRVTFNECNGLLSIYGTRCN